MSYDPISTLLSIHLSLFTDLNIVSVVSLLDI